MGKIKYWTQEENDFLINNYEKLTRKQVAEKLGRTEFSVKRRIKTLGISKESLKKSNWSQEEDDFLKESYEELSSQEIAEKLNRSEIAVKARFRMLGFKKFSHWSQEEEDFLKNNYKEMSFKEIGEKLGRTANSVRNHVQTLGLTRKNYFSEGEDYFIKSNYQDMSNKEMAEILNRPIGAINSRVTRLGLKKLPKFETDSDTHKTCRSCLQLLPKTREIFGNDCNNSYCKECASIKAKEHKILKQLRTEKKEKEREKEEFAKSIANNKYICRKCGEEKLGTEMKVNWSRKPVEKICRKCDAIERKERELKRIEKLDFSLK